MLFVLFILEMSLEDDTVLCIEAEDDSFLWSDIRPPWHMGSGGHDRFCPICEKRISNKIKRHVEREHLPWWFNPTKACWSCKQSVTSACFLRRDHAHCTPPANLLNHWIWKTNALLHIIARCLNLPFLELVRNHIAARQEWYPWSDDCTLSFEQRIVMRMWEAGNRLNMSNIDSFTISPPAAVACLLHWKVMACVLQHLPFSVQTEVKMSEQECDYGGDPVVLRCLPALGQLVDSHCHIDLLFRRHNVDDLMMLREKVRQRKWNLHYVVGNYVFPEYWHTMHQHVNSHDSIYATVGLHPHVASNSCHIDTHTSMPWIHYCVIRNVSEWVK